MVRDYELMYIVRPDVDEDALNAAVESVKSLIEAQSGEIVKTTMWGKRRLAYEVKHLRDGHYVIVNLRLDGARVTAIERALSIHDSVFRHLLVVQETPVTAAVEPDIPSVLAAEVAPGAAGLDDAEAEIEAELDEVETEIEVLELEAAVVAAEEEAI